MNWHSLSAQETLSRLSTNQNGLPFEEITSRYKQNGPNQLNQKKSKSLWLLFFRQFINPLIYLLLLAACIKFAFSSPLDGSVLFATIFIMVLISFIQEAKAEKAMKALQSLSSDHAKVKREGKIQIIPTHQVVPGDIIILEAGNKVPADGRIISSTNFMTNESSLTGESMPVNKDIHPISQHEILAQRSSMVYTGTSVVRGKAIYVVTETGMQTEIGKIATSILEVEHEQTPLQKSIQTISKWMFAIVCFIVTCFIAISFFQGISWMDVFFISISASVAAIPEGLPVAVTVVLATGMKLMAKHSAIIRRLIAVETLGSTTVICSDKTGTLTLNEMHVTQIGLNHAIHPFSSSLEKSESLQRLMTIITLCNDAIINGSDEIEPIGDPTESALLYAAKELGYEKTSLEQQVPRIAELPFQSETLYMATLHSVDNLQMVYVKGSPEKILELSSHILIDQKKIELNPINRSEVENMIQQMANQGLRLIACADYKFHTSEQHFDEEAFKGKLTLIGLIGLEDPPRKEVVNSIELCKQAGIRVCMVTGDNPITAKAIATQIGLKADKVILGKEIQEKRQDINDACVFARIDPVNKLEIVKAFKEKGEIVAMTGDGVNDAPALEIADIGIAMGQVGSDVAKESAEMVLADDNFSTIITAIEQGRAIFNRLRYVCAFLLTTCFGELFALISCVLFSALAPLIPVQILWINLVTGALIAIPLSLEPKSGTELKQPPRDKNVHLVYPGMIFKIGFISFILGFSVFILFEYSLNISSLIKARTMAFSSIVIFEWLLALNIRSDYMHCFKKSFFKNYYLFITIGLALILQLCIMYIPILNLPFTIVPLSPFDWLVASLPGLFVFIIETVRKAFFPNLFSLGKWKKSS